jgi:hypothetical protein
MLEPRMRQLWQVCGSYDGYTCYGCAHYGYTYYGCAYYGCAYYGCAYYDST